MYFRASACLALPHNTFGTFSSLQIKSEVQKPQNYLLISLFKNTFKTIVSSMKAEERHLVSFVRLLWRKICIVVFASCFESEYPQRRQTLSTSWLLKRLWPEFSLFRQQSVRSAKMVWAVQVLHCLISSELVPQSCYSTRTGSVKDTHPLEARLPSSFHPKGTGASASLWLISRPCLIWHHATWSWDWKAFMRTQRTEQKTHGLKIHLGN